MRIISGSPWQPDPYRILGIDAEQQLDSGDQARPVQPDFRSLGVQAQQRQFGSPFPPSNQAATKLLHSLSIFLRSLSSWRLPCTVANRSCPFDENVAMARLPSLSRRTISVSFAVKNHILGPRRHQPAQSSVGHARPRPRRGRPSSSCPTSTLARISSRVPEVSASTAPFDRVDATDGGG